MMPRQAAIGFVGLATVCGACVDYLIEQVGGPEYEVLVDGHWLHCTLLDYAFDAETYSTRLEHVEYLNLLKAWEV